MNRAAVGVGPWLLRERTRPVSLDAVAPLLEGQSYMAWLAAEQEGTAEAQAFAVVLDEIWQAELTPQEQQVLREFYWEGRTEAQAARALSLHHSTVARLHTRALEKLEQHLRYVMRYRELLKE